MEKMKFRFLFGKIFENLSIEAFKRKRNRWKQNLCRQFIVWLEMSGSKSRFIGAAAIFVLLVLPFMFTI